MSVNKYFDDFRIIDFGGSSKVGEKCGVNTKYYRSPYRNTKKCLENKDYD